MHIPSTCEALDCKATAGDFHATVPCMVPDVLRGVQMHHSDDVVEVWHGLDTPAVGCGFHATYYAAELFAAHRELV